MKIILGLIYFFFIIVPLGVITYYVIEINSWVLWYGYTLGLIFSLVILVILPYYWKNKLKDDKLKEYKFKEKYPNYKDN